MRKLLLLLSLVAVVLAALLTFELRRRDAEAWSTDSPAALAAFKRGLQAYMHLYGEDASREFEAALAADPGFLAPHFFLLGRGRGRGHGDEHAAAIRAVDPNTLRPRERYLAAYFRAVVDHDEEGEGRAVATYLAARPRDPWALHLAAVRARNQGEWGRAEELYERLVKADPNWVLAHNHLGYLAMGQGRFADAEARFRTYAFVAPDQANPHDSLGELLVLRGRYDEAREELERALALRPDFCSSYRNLLRAVLFADQPEEAGAILDRARAHCPEPLVAALSCQVAAWVALRDDAAAAFWPRSGEECPRAPAPLDLLRFRVALIAGDREAVAAQLLAVSALVGTDPEQAAFGAAGTPLAARLHMTALVALAAGQPAMASEGLRRADENLLYFGPLGGGTFKLFNRAVLAFALDRSGRHGEAVALREEIAAVNPKLAAFFDTELVSVPGS